MNVCRHPGCGTVISAYRAGRERCSRHDSTDPLAAFLPGWAPRGACAGSDTALFDVEYPSAPAAWPPIPGPMQEAKRLCVECPVRRECLEYAFALEDMPLRDPAVGETGRPTAHRELVYGGLTGKERADLARMPNRLELGLARLERQWSVMDALYLEREEATA